MKTLIFFAVFIAAVYCTDDNDAGKYLQKYGYYNPNSFDQSDLKTAIKTFQRTYNLPVTGEVDDATKKLMNTPRCGLPDRASMRNAFADSQWSKKSLTYYFASYTNDLSRSEVERITADALKFWSDVTPLKFTRSYNRNADIIIGFGSGRHSDTRKTCGYPFDGRSGTLAHAFFPPDGRLHYDDAEQWTDNTYNGQNLLSTAVHELGHILGLEHDQNTRDSIMYPYAMPYTPNLKLHANDIYRIQRLYGKGSGTGTGGTGTGGSNCKDQVNDCPNWKNRCSGYSQAWTDYMRKYCKKTCNLRC